MAPERSLSWLVSIHHRRMVESEWVMETARATGSEKAMERDLVMAMD